MLIPFSPPRIDDKTIDAVKEVLQSGWITTGPKTKEFEKKLAEYCGVSHVICLNSATAGLELALRWFGIKEGDEVIVPAYTYCASANVIVHCGAKPVMVDVNEDFTLNVEQLKRKITSRTKAVIPVDFAGYPCNYDEINQVVSSPEMVSRFSPGSPNQKLLGRILVVSDAAHSIGAIYKGKRTGSLTDISVFSFHAVKNLTTAEGGAVCLRLPPCFDQDEIYRDLCRISLHGQSKDALSKMQVGNWKYDVLEAGYKCNMTDMQAAIGLVELERYDGMLKRRKEIFDRYSESFRQFDCFQIPEYESEDRISSYHVYPLRIKSITEKQRDAVIQAIFSRDVSVNVHFIPLPLLTFYKTRGYCMADYPVSYDNYSREISLPVYYDLSDEQIERVIHAVTESVSHITLR